MAGPRILIVRLSALGDCILTMPMLCALRRGLPRASISWLTHPEYAPVLEGHPCLNEVITAPRGYLTSASKIWNLRRVLRPKSFDITIDPQSLLKSSFAAWLTGAPQRIGFDRPLARERSYWLNNTRIRPTHSHIIDHHRELLTPLGILPGEVEFQVPVNPTGESKIRAWLSDQGVQRFCVFNPGAAWPSKCWPLDRYADTARKLFRATSVPTIVAWGGRTESEWADQVVAMARGAAIKAPRTDLRELTSLLRRASVFVGSDTGPLHLAEAVGTPCVGIYGPTRIENSGPYGDEHVVLQKKYQGGSAKERRTATNQAICLIQVDELAEVCERVLLRSSEHAAA